MQDKKFGFGGKKRWAKSNTAKSSADMTTFSSVKHSKTPARKPGGGGGAVRGKRKKVPAKPKRLGKSRRQRMKLKR